MITDHCQGNKHVCRGNVCRQSKELKWFSNRCQALKQPCYCFTGVSTAAQTGGPSPKAAQPAQVWSKPSCFVLLEGQQPEQPFLICLHPFLSYMQEHSTLVYTSRFLALFFLLQVVYHMRTVNLNSFLVGKTSPSQELIKLLCNVSIPRWIQGILSNSSGDCYHKFHRA